MMTGMSGYQLASADQSRIDAKYFCPKCQGLLREAVQVIACGHGYCKECVDLMLRSVKLVVTIYPHIQSIVKCRVVIILCLAKFSAILGVYVCLPRPVPDPRRPRTCNRM